MEVEFRAKSKYENLLVYGNYTKKWIKLIDGRCVLQHYIEFQFNDGDKIREGFTEIDEKTLSMYIGIKDFDGRKVYGGDVVEWLDFSKYKYRTLVDNKFKIVWQPKKCGFGLKAFSDIVPILGIQAGAKMKVIGNIYVNPELFKN